MRFYQISAVLLVLLVTTAIALPFDAKTSDEIDIGDNSVSQEESESNEQQTKEELFSDEIPARESNESSVDEKQIEEENLSADEIRIVKRSSDIPDPEVPNEYPTHDEYQEWKSKQSRYRRTVKEEDSDADDNDDDSDNNDDNDNNHNDDDQDDLKSFDNTLDEQNVLTVPESHDENSLEDYAQGCEFDSSEMNEVTYNGFNRRRRSVKGDKVVAEEDDVDGIDNDSADVDEDDNRDIASSEESGQVSVEEAAISEDDDLSAVSVEYQQNLSHSSDESD